MRINLWPSYHESLIIVYSYYSITGRQKEILLFYSKTGCAAITYFSFPPWKETHIILECVLKKVFAPQESFHRDWWLRYFHWWVVDNRNRAFASLMRFREEIFHLFVNELINRSLSLRHTSNGKEFPASRNSKSSLQSFMAVAFGRTNYTH